MKKNNIIYTTLILSYILSQSIMSSSTKRYYEEINDLSYEKALKKQKTDYSSVENLLNKLSTKLFLDRQDYQFIKEKNIKKFEAASFDKNIWHSFILIGHYFKKLDQIPFIILEEIKKMETQDNVGPHATFNVGLLYYLGQGVEKSDEKACIWYRKAADQGHVVAQFNLGLMYLDGQGVHQSNIEGVKWYQKAADQGHLDSQFNLGLVYQDGRGIQQNSIEAVKWYRKAADQGHSDAQFNLGLMYQKGQGVEQNDTKTFEWHQMAADQGHSDAQFSLGLMYQKGQGVEQNDTKALEWHQTAADQGHAVAQFNLGLMYLDGQGVDKNIVKAFKWHQKAADQGYVVAQNSLGAMYANGRGIEQSDKKAFEWYQKASDQGYAVAQNSLGVMYANGQGIEQSDTKAFEWYQKASDQGYVVAQNSLGMMYANGRGKDQNYVKALELFKKSAIRKHNLAQKNFRSFFNIKSFVTNVKEDSDFKNHLKILINDIELIMNLHKQEKEINDPDAFFERELCGIKNLFKLYKKIIDFEQNSLEVVRVFDNPEFMITCLQPIHQELIKELNKDEKQYMSLCMTNGLKFLNFGFKNVELANKFISLTNDQNNKWIKAIQTLTKVNTKLYQTYLKKAIKTQNAMKETQDPIESDPSCKNLEKKLALEAKLKKFNVLIDNVEIKLKSFEKLSKIPNKIKDLFVQTIAYRNQLFFMQNSFLQEE